MKRIDVAVGIIKKGNKIYISKRSEALHQGGKWEFPGGKQEPNEKIEQTLARELLEEVGIVITQQHHYMFIEHDYGDKNVALHIGLVEAFDGVARHQEGQQSLWVDISDLAQYDFPAANQPIVKQLIADYL
jgi:8-oxo-dGTP diphosphatase